MMEDMKIALPLTGHQVIEHNTVRRLAYLLNMGQRREGDRLLLFADQGEDGTFYVNPPVKDYDRHSEGYSNRTPEPALLVSLYVDEGYYNGCLVGETVERMNKPWFEMVDSEEFLRACVTLLAPDFKAEPSPFVGAGSSQRHYRAQWVKVLSGLTHPRVEFIAPKEDADAA